MLEVFQLLQNSKKKVNEISNIKAANIKAILNRKLPKIVQTKSEMNIKEIK